MSHAPSLLYPSQLNTPSLSTLSICTPVRPSTRPSSRPPLTLSSHADYTCADPSNSSFGPVPESTSPTHLASADLEILWSSLLCHSLYGAQNKVGWICWLERCDYPTALLFQRKLLVWSNCPWQVLPPSPMGPVRPIPSSLLLCRWGA